MSWCLSCTGKSEGKRAEARDEPAMEVAMIVIALRYDALNRVFIPLGDEAAGLFEDGELYLVTISDSGRDVNVESFDLRQPNIAHA